MNRRATLRASDAEREQVAERLRRASVEGRLAPDELEERMSIALSAKTYGELDAVLSDLPGPVAPRRTHELSPRRRLTRPVMVAIVMALVVVGAVISAIGGHSHSGHGGGFIDGAPVFWLVWIVLGWRYFGRRHRSPRLDREARWDRSSSR